MEYLIVSFRSRNETIGFYKFLSRQGFSAEVVNTPKEAGVGCGLSVKVSKNVYGALRYLLMQYNGKSFAGIFKVTNSNHGKRVQPF